MVDSLYKDHRSLLIGSAGAVASALISAWKTADVMLFLCAVAIAAVAVARTLDFRAYALRRLAADEGDATRWERRYIVGAACHVALLGLWCLLCFVRTADTSVHLLSFALTLAYLVGVSGRNFTSGPLVHTQILCAGVPMIAALVVAGPDYYPVVVFVLIPLFLAIELISGRLRSLFRDAIRSSRKASLLAAQLDATLDNLSQGVCMFDAEQRVVVCNDSYPAMYGLTPEQVRPGTSLREIVQHRIAAGLYAGPGPDEYLRERLSSLHKAWSHQELCDGRTIFVTRRDLPDGGWVAMHQDVTEQRRNEARIAHLAHHDTLTGLPNRALLNERLQAALASIQPGEMVVAHLLDLDLFKKVNDTLGHAAGDRLLKLVGQRLRELVRETDTVARMGGDEFAILQVPVVAADDAIALARRVIDAVSKPFPVDGREVVIATSVGLAMGPYGDPPAPDQLMRNADLALYRAKEKGHGTFCFFEPRMEDEMQARATLESDLRQALARHEIELHYQPIVHLESNRICCFEALMRWRHPIRGLVPPCEFIPVAEEIGLIVRLGEWAIREACAAATQWPERISVAVNLSPRQLSGSGLVQTVLGALSASGLAADRLELEITETSLLQNNDATVALLHRLREQGVRIAMDDFGTGYSSLSYLQSFPFDRIKIDRMFIRDITENAGSLNIVRAAIGLATGMKMATTAEGVETKEQLDMLRWENCTEAQGFLFGKSCPQSEISQLLASHGAGAHAPAKRRAS